jgi:NitT/TauT family transport system substrate-binding protein
MHWQSKFLAASAVGVSMFMMAHTAKAAEDITLFLQPIVPYDSVWMADEKGFFEEEGLNITYQLFPSGTTALVSFRVGEGDILLGGDFPGLQYWVQNDKNYRLIAAIDRDPSSYLVTARKEITSGEDLRGKKIATRVGSTVDWFMSVYLEAHGMTKDDVEVINLDGQVMPAALCQGDIDAFFFWQPYNDTAIEICPDIAHNLSDADGYIPGYSIAAARPEWLEENPEIAISFLRGMLRGKEVAENDLEAVIAYADRNLSMPREIVEAQWPVKNRIIALNDVVYEDYCNLAEWMRGEGLLEGELDLSEFVWTEGLEAIDPSRVSEPPAPC